MIIYRHSCHPADIAERQRLLDMADIPIGYDAILTTNRDMAGWTNVDDVKGECQPTAHESRLVQRIATMYATLPLDILNRIDID